MTHPILLTFLGVALIGASFALKKFYTAKGALTALLSDEPIPAWPARLALRLVGSMTILAGFNLLFPGFWP